MIKSLHKLSSSRSRRRSSTTFSKVGIGALSLSLAALGTISSSGAGAAASGAKLAGAASTSKLTPIVVQLALMPPKMVFLGFYAAQDEGFYARNGLKVKLVAESTGVQAIRGMVAGEGFFAAGGTDGLAGADAGGAHLKGIWDYATDDLSIIASKNITSLKGLVGKTIGITDKVGPAYTLPVLALSTVGLKANAANYVILGGRPALVTALASNRIQAAAFHVDDGLTVVKKDPQVHIIAQMSQLVPKWWYGAVTVDQSYAQSHATVVKEFLTALIETQRWMYANPAKTIALGIKYTGFAPDVVAKSYKILSANHNWSINKAGLNPTDVNYTLGFFKTSGVVPPKSTISYKSIIDTSYLDAVLAKIGQGKY
jgi:NitT/TauT family transport system substrate-binding protein